MHIFGLLDFNFYKEKDQTKIATNTKEHFPTCRRLLVLSLEKTYNDIRFCKEVKTILVIDIRLHFLRNNKNYEISYLATIGAREISKLNPMQTD